MRQNNNKYSYVYEEGTWTDFRDEVKKVNYELYDIIEQISPDKKYKLVKVQYPYGEYILERGIPRLPYASENYFRVDNPCMPSHLKEQLCYCSTPLALQLKNSGEVFLETNDRIVPLYIFSPGSLFGLFESASYLSGRETTPIWDVTAGARSVLMVPKISDAIAHNKIRTELGIKNNVPKTLSDHWSLFKTIATKINQENPWHCDILFFTKNWLDNKNDGTKWLKFHNYLLQKSWIQSSHMRTRTEMNIFWEKFSSAIGKRHLRPNSYIVATVKHLIYLALGQNPGFKAADESELALPSKIIENVYQNIYSLKEYAPTILHAHHLGESDKNLALFYSLAYPTLLESTPNIRHKVNINIMSELREMSLLMEMLLKILEDSEYEKGQYNIIKNTLFKYLHGERDRFGELASAEEVVFDDLTIRQSLEKRFLGKKFAKNGQFFKGCIEMIHI